MGIELFAEDIPDRLDVIVQRSWEIFINQFIWERHRINLEAPFQLHFASILKSIGDMYCLQKDEVFEVNMEVDFGIDKKNYVDIVLNFYKLSEKKEFIVPIELKFKTENQSAADIGVMEIYKDIYTLEDIRFKEQSDVDVACGYFFCITDYQAYVNMPRKGLKTVFKTYQGALIEVDTEYLYRENKTGLDYFNKNGSCVYKNEYLFDWQNFKMIGTGKEQWFLSIKV